MHVCHELPLLIVLQGLRIRSESELESQLGNIPESKANDTWGFEELPTV